jgi:hypothetical protein
MCLVRLELGRVQTPPFPPGAASLEMKFPLCHERQSLSHVLSNLTASECSALRSGVDRPKENGPKYRAFASVGKYIIGQIGHKLRESLLPFECASPRKKRSLPRLSLPRLRLLNCPPDRAPPPCRPCKKRARRSAGPHPASTPGGSKWTVWIPLGRWGRWCLLVAPRVTLDAYLPCRLQLLAFSHPGPDIHRGGSAGRAKSFPLGRRGYI